MPRTTHLDINDDTLERIEIVTGRDALHQALGYLSRWASGSTLYAHADIMGSDDSSGTELVASYRPVPGGRIAYQIGAVWHPQPAGGHFSFHS